MKKKILSVLLAFVLCSTISACTEGASGADINTTGNTDFINDTFAESADGIASDTFEDITVPAQTVTAEEGGTEPVDQATEAEQTAGGIPQSTSGGTSGTSQTVQTTPAQTTVTVPAATAESPAQKWTETVVSGTMYVNTNGVYSRVYALEGSTRVKQYSLNQAVSVVARTNTGYYKLRDGEYIHGDYLSTGKVTAAATTPKPVVTTTTPATTQKPPAVTTAAQESGGNKNQRPQTQSELDFSNRVFELINAERAKEGLAPFKKMNTVTEVANLRAWELIESFGHDRPNGGKFSTAFNEKGLVYGWFGENIAAGQTTPEEVVSAWMNSPSHRDNILSDYEYMGVGYYKVTGTRYTHYWTQNFYSPA